MIPFSHTSLESPKWQEQLAAAFNSPASLLHYLGLDDHITADRESPAADFPLRVTKYFADLMKKGDINDPLLRQVLPAAEETQVVAGFTSDPVADLVAERGAGILQKYAGRALLITSGACAINCRYCFRRHFPYQEHSAIRHQWSDAISRLQQMTDIKEVILSGGDPLTLSDQRLTDLISRLSEIPHLQRLRIHTRLPVVLPKRVTPSLVSSIATSRLTGSLVIHANHPNEITPDLAAALSPLRASGVQLLNQSVLLKGVNDQSETLIELSEKLFSAGVLPYYLHVLDPVDGAAHFRVDSRRFQQLAASLRESLPGYLAPRLVVEKKGANSKLPVDNIIT